MGQIGCFDKKLKITAFSRYCYIMHADYIFIVFFSAILAWSASTTGVLSFSVYYGGKEGYAHSTL